MSKVQYISPGGHRYQMECRDGTTDDLVANSSAYPNNEYNLPHGLAGWALDVGAHIGSVTVPLLLDNPDLRVIAIEAIPENVAALMANVDGNGVGDRCIVVHAAASDTPDEQRIGYSLNFPPDDNAFNQANRFIGSMNAPAGVQEVHVKGVTLRGAMLLRGPAQDDPIVWMKIDCEGCEYKFLRSKHIEWVEYIIGEHHFGFGGLETLLSETHSVKILSGTADFGTFEAVLQ